MIPGRWVLDALARELAADQELNAARDAIYRIKPNEDQRPALERYITALEARNALRDGAS